MVILLNSCSKQNHFICPSTSEGWPPTTVWTVHRKWASLFRESKRTLKLHSFSFLLLERWHHYCVCKSLTTSFTCRILTPAIPALPDGGFLPESWRIAPLRHFKAHQLPGMELAVCYGSEDLGGGWIWFSWTCLRLKLFLLHYSEKWKLSLSQFRVLKQKCW